MMTCQDEWVSDNLIKTNSVHVYIFIDCAWMYIDTFVYSYYIMHYFASILVQCTKVQGSGFNFSVQLC
jgi:hypothetical protein